MGATNSKKKINVNPSEKTPTFKLRDESPGGLRLKRHQTFFFSGMWGKSRQSCLGGGGLYAVVRNSMLTLA